jgi:hypothetical protein
VSIDVLYRVAAVLGLDVSLRVFPAGDAIRDAAHGRLLGRPQRQLHRSLRWQTEVPLPDHRDPRSWDAVISGRGWVDRVEAETAIDDAQAVERRLALKRRDGRADHVLLLIADTRRNRAALAAAPQTFADYPLRGRAILAALRDGRDPGGSGIVLL